MINLYFIWLVFALSADLLYLYFIGTWYDPILIIEYTEVAALIVIMLSSLVYFVGSVRLLYSRRKSNQIL